LKEIEEAEVPREELVVGRLVGHCDSHGGQGLGFVRAGIGASVKALNTDDAALAQLSEQLVLESARRLLCLHTMEKALQTRLRCLRLPGRSDGHSLEGGWRRRGEEELRTCGAHEEAAAVSEQRDPGDGAQCFHWIGLFHSGHERSGGAKFWR
jgi:hypothetical protein